MKPLTDRQREIVSVIYNRQKEGNTPTLFEIAEAIGVSSRQTIKNHLDAIAKKGWLKREPRRSRAIILNSKVVFEIEKNKKHWRSMQSSLGLVFEEKPNEFAFYGSGNVVIDRGIFVENSDKILIDTSSIIDNIAELKNQPNTQFVVEKYNADKLQEDIYERFTSSCDYIIVSAIVPYVSFDTGYIFLDGNQSPYTVVWSGLGTNHYYWLGKEYGSTSNIAIVDDRGQTSMFPQNMNINGIHYTIERLRKKLIS